MDVLFFVLAFMCLIALITGLIKPAVAIRWGSEERKTRKNVLLYYGIGFLACFILFASNIDSDSTKTNKTVSKSMTENEQVLTDKEKALKVDKLIKDFGDVNIITLDSSHKIETARTEYNKLNDSQKILVTKLETLVSAETKIAELQKEADKKAEEEAKKIAHEKWVTSQFSAWDGSHRALVKLVKENMNDDNSFDHVETKYLVLSSQEQIDELGCGEIGDLYLYMKFRGANAFGGIILSEVEALSSYKKNTITILNDF